MSGAEIPVKLGLYNLAWPIFVEQLLRLMLGYVSVFMLGHYSDEAVAATGVANQVLAISVIFYGFLTVGVQIVVAQLLGAKRFKRVERVKSGTQLTLELNTHVVGSERPSVINELVILYM